MDSTKNRLAVIRELLDESYDCPRCLAVEAGCWLIEKDEDVGLGSKFYAYRQTLPLFDVET